MMTKDNLPDHDRSGFLTTIGKKIMDLRYFKQFNLKEAKKKLILRQNKFTMNSDLDKIKEENAELDKYSKERWNRQMNLPLISQTKIQNLRITVFGCGGLGSNVLLGLSYWGVQNLNIIDFDKVELSNLNRQTLYTLQDIGKLKIKRAHKRLLEINPNIIIKSLNLKLNYPKELNLFNKNLEDVNILYPRLNELVKNSDFIVNAMDLNGAPYLINDLCVINRKPFYWGGINHFLGEIFSYTPGTGNACLRCIFGPDHYFSKICYLRYRTSENNNQPSVNNATTVIITGNFIAEMIIKDALGIKNDCKGKYVIYDGYEMEVSKIKVVKDTKCECNNYENCK